MMSPLLLWKREEIDEDVEETVTSMAETMAVDAVANEQNSVYGEQFCDSADLIDKKLNSEFHCACKQNNAKQCSDQFSQDEGQTLRLNHIQITRNELDLVVLSQIHASIKFGSKTEWSKRAKQKDLQCITLRWQYTLTKSKYEFSYKK